MGLCKGVENWFECLSCPHICTRSCPIEGENVFEEMKKQIHDVDHSGTPGPREPFLNLD